MVNGPHALFLLEHWVPTLSDFALHKVSLRTLITTNPIPVVAMFETRFIWGSVKLLNVNVDTSTYKDVSRSI